MQGWSKQLHHWANISTPILKRAAKQLLMTNSHYFTSFSANFFDVLFLRTSYFPRYTCQKPIPPKFFRNLNKIDLPRKIFPPIRKGVKLDNSKKGHKSLPSVPHAALGPRVGHPCSNETISNNGANFKQNPFFYPCQGHCPHCGGNPIFYRSPGIWIWGWEIFVRLKRCTAR